MKSKLFILLLFMLSNYSYSQNLVPNPSFENDDTGDVFCGIYMPVNFNSSVFNWITPTQGTPDLFSTHIDQSCWNFQPNSTYNGPITLKGPQLPRTGHVMAGLFGYTLSGFNQREYVQSQLIFPLVPGNIYYVEFYASLADNTESSIDRLGVYLSDSPISLSTDGVFNFVPQIVSSGYISDTSAWTKVYGTFQATSANNYITIGNFFDDNSTTTTINPHTISGPGSYGAYYFIDDVSVIDFTTAVEKVITEDQYNVYPNPASDILYISGTSSDDSEFILYDLASREMSRHEFRKSTTINIEDLSNGIYIYRIKSKSGKITNGKIVVR